MATEKEKTKITTNIIIALIVCFALGFGAGWYVQGSRVGSPDKELGAPGQATEEELGESLGQLAAPAGISLAGDNIQIAVADQSAGETVKVDTASLAQVSWLAVRDYQGGAMGSILGAKRLEGGKHREVVVELLRPTQPNQDYIIVVYLDDGDLAFDSKRDQLVKKDGQPWIAATFKII